MRRTHLRGHKNILKRLLIHVAGFNLGILMRRLIGTATPREYAGLLAAVRAALWQVNAAILRWILAARATLTISPAVSSPEIDTMRPLAA
jgi:transposase